jgi:hypothetical protein
MIRIVLLEKNLNVAFIHMAVFYTKFEKNKKQYSLNNAFPKYTKTRISAKWLKSYDSLKIFFGQFLTKNRTNAPTFKNSRLLVIMD